MFNPDFVADLRKHFRGDIRLDPASRVLYSTDASMYQIEPLGVAIPKTQDDLLAAVELAAKYKIPILPRGAGSSLGGQAIGEALILDCSRFLDSIVEINPGTHSAIVEPGVVLATLNRAAAKHGLMFGPDPASAERATMGGVIGNNATGAHSILYGMAADHIISVDAILSDGSAVTFDDSIFDTRQMNSDSRISNIEFPLSPATVNQHKQTTKDDMSEFMMTGLRLTQEGVSENEFQVRFGKSLREGYGDEIEELLKMGLIESKTSEFLKNSEVLRLTQRGRLLGNQVFMRFV